MGGGGWGGWEMRGVDEGTGRHGRGVEGRGGEGRRGGEKEDHDDPPARSHCSSYQHWLPRELVVDGDEGVERRERSGRSFAVDEETPRHTPSSSLAEV